MVYDFLLFGKILGAQHRVAWPLDRDLLRFGDFLSIPNRWAGLVAAGPRCHARAQPHGDRPSGSPPRSMQDNAGNRKLRFCLLIFDSF